MKKIFALLLVLSAIIILSSCDNTELPEDHIHVEVIDEARAPDCQTAGLTEGKHCSECGEIIIPQQEIEKTECTPVWVVNKEATKTEDGERSYVCTVCHKLYYTSVIPGAYAYIKYKENSDGGYTVTEIPYNYPHEDAVIPATYKGKPVTEIGGTVLGRSLNSLYIPESVTKIAEDAFNYEFMQTRLIGGFTVSSDNPAFLSIADNLYSKDGSILIRYANASPNPTFSLPSSVTEVASYAFKGTKAITEILLPDGVLSIGDDAFGDCSSLSEIKLCDGLTSIGKGAFTNCEALASLELPDSVGYIGSYAFQFCFGLTELRLPESLTVISDGIFWECKNLVSISIPDGVTRIEEQAFIGCYALSNVTLPESLMYIGSNAFFSCSGIKSIQIPASVTQIAERAFYECRGMESFTVHPDNQVYTAVDGVLYEKNTHILLCYPAGCGNVAFKVPDQVKEIAASAFYYCEMLREVVIPDSVTKIGRAAFENCFALETVRVGGSITEIPESAFTHCGLKEIHLPDSLTVIGEYAFNWCDLSSVYFDGSIEAWEKVVKKPHFDDLSKDYTVYCTDGEISPNGSITEY